MQANITDVAQMIKIIKGLGDELWDDHLVFSLEGDYNLKALVASVKATFDMLLGENIIEDPPGQSPPGREPPGTASLDITLGENIIENPLGKSLRRSEALNTASLIKEMKERHNLA